MTQPAGSGAPTPVQGVTGGPTLNQGNASIDPGSGNIVFTPPGNAVEIKKSPSAFNVYEFFNSSTDNVRIALETALGGPEFIGVRAAPAGVNRDLLIDTVGTGVVNIPKLNLASVKGNFGSLPLVLNQSVPNSVGTPAVWNNGSFTTNQTGLYTAGAGGITIVSAGVYLVTLWVQYNVAASPGTRRDVNLTVFGVAMQATPLTTGVGAVANLSGVGTVPAATVISCNFFQDSGAALTIAQGVLMISRLGAN